MTVSLGRKLAALALGAVALAAIPTAASATDFSIDTNVTGGKAWISDVPGSAVGSITSPGHTGSVYIGAIDLKGQLTYGAPNTLTTLKTFCIDIAAGLHNGVFKEVLPAEMHVSYSAAQMTNVFKYLVYATGQGITNPLNSAATQLGLWEIITESGPAPTWNLSDGAFKVSMGSGQPDAVGTATTWLNNFSTTNTGNYTLHVLDPGSGNQIQAFVTESPVPDPASWMTMILGFGAIGGGVRHRRRAVGRAVA